MTPDKIKDELMRFVQSVKLEKLETEEKLLLKTVDEDKKQQILQKIAELHQKYSFSNWIDYAANFMAKQIKFGSHHPKGIHSSAKIECDNIYFDLKTPIPAYLCASQHIRHFKLDASGNAAALPLVKFFDIYVDDEKTIRLVDLLLQDHHVLEQCFSDDLELSRYYKQQFQKALINDFKKPISYEKCKQLLWVNSDYSIENNDYTCLIPLYPSSLIYDFYKKVQFVKYDSEENKLNRDNRKKVGVVQLPYKNLVNLAIFKVGGANPQGVGQLASEQGGKNYLLPSLPPIFKSSKVMRLNLASTTIFNDELAYVCRAGFYTLYHVVEAKKNVYTVRDDRIKALNMILEGVLRTANVLQKQSPGWSKEYQLNMHEKYWLDPKRAELTDEEAFRAEREKGDWVEEVERGFALWVNRCLKRRFPKLAHDFDDAEYHEWRRNIRRSLRYRLRHP